MFKKRVCRDIERDKTLGFGCYHSPNGTQQSYSGDLFPIEEMKCDVCQLTTKDILLHICHNKRRNPGENKICSTCTIAVSQSTQNEIHKNREINWTIQNHRTPIVTALICVKVIAEIRRYIHQNDLLQKPNTAQWTYSIVSERKIERMAVDAQIDVKHGDTICYTILGIIYS